MVSRKGLVAACAVAFCCNVALMVLFVKYNSGEKCFITLDENQHVTATMPDNFLSIGIDSDMIHNYKKIDFANGKLRQLAAALAPARLRLGGTMAERLIFSKIDFPASCQHCKALCSPIQQLCKHKVLPFFLMTSKQWTEVNEFCKATKLKLLFTLNALLRYDDNSWDELNAKALLEFTRSQNYEVDWQLGNEPNSYKHVFNVSLSPRTLANDFKKLRNILNDLGFQDSLLVGPDTTRPQPKRPSCLEYMREFLVNGSKQINAAAWHQYYVNSRNTSLEDFWNPDIFDLLKQQIETMRNHTKKYKHLPMWLSETSSAYGGGAPGLSNSYAGSPLWLDKLGLAAKYNITTVVRQSLVGGNYSLLDGDLEPLPDWWVSILYKKLVGNKVLKVDCKCSRYQRLYAHCANRKYTNDTSAVTIFGVNLEMAKARFLLQGSALHGENIIIDEFILSAPSNNRRTKTLLLNGWGLYYEDSIPDLQPVVHKYGNHIQMPPYSMAFWVVKNTSIKVCN